MFFLPARRVLEPLRGYAVAFALVSLAVATSLVFRRLPYATLSLLFVLVVLVVATRSGLWPAIFASVLGFFALNFFFTEPHYTFSVDQQGDVATLVFFLLIAVITGNLAARMRNEMAGNRAALERVSALLDFSRQMAAARDEHQALQVLVDRAAAIFRSPVVALLPDGAQRWIASAQNLARKEPCFHLEEAERAWLASGGKSVHSGAWTYLPLETPAGAIGVVCIGASRVPHEKRQLGDALCEQASIAIERTRLVDSLRTAQLVSEKERLRTALLSSVSHDLRTPLASIIGSATSVIEYNDAIKPDDQRALLQTIRDESERLDRYIQNLLEMTRFGQPGLALKREWVDLNDLIAAAVKRLGAALSDCRLRVDVAADAAVIFAQGALLEQVIVNLLENAAEFSSPGGCIVIAARADGGNALLDVTDQGPGIPEDERANVFDLFYRAAQGDRRRQGTGLGLAICRSIIAAHSGTIEAVAADGGGTRMRIVLPRARLENSGDVSAQG